MSDGKKLKDEIIPNIAKMMGGLMIQSERETAALKAAIGKNYKGEQTIGLGREIDAAGRE